MRGWTAWGSVLVLCALTSVAAANDDLYERLCRDASGTR